MTRSRIVRLAAGVMVLALLAGACSALGIGGSGGYEIKAEFARTYNLFPGSPVRVLGIDVGKIVDLSIPAGQDTVTVTIHVDDEVDLPTDVSAVIIPEALLGERYVQLDPPYTGGETMEPGETIPLERTDVPAEFDEVLEGLNDFVEGLDADEVGRLTSNLATVIDGQGERLGQTIDQVHDAIQVLRDNDEELVSLAGRLADLNATLGTRDQQLGAIIEDWNTVARSLADDRQQLDAALRGLVRLTTRAADLLETHREDVEADIEVLTRVGRTAHRNLDQLSLVILSSAELFRHAERVVDRKHNWLPLVNHDGHLAAELTETLIFRLEGVCLGAGLSPEECEQLPLRDLLEGGNGEICMPPLVPCEEESVTVADAIRSVVREHPEIGDELLRDDGTDEDDSGGSLLDRAIDDALRGVGSSETEVAQ